MRISTFTTCCLALLSLLLLTSHASPVDCPPATKSRSAIRMEEAYYLLKDTYSLITTAVLSKGEVHDRAIEEARKRLDRVDDLCEEALLLLPEDGKFMHEWYFSFTLDRLSIKAEAARAMLNAGVPSWPFLGKALAKTQSIWSSIKNKIKGLFSKGGNEEVAENDVDADTKKKAETMAEDLNQTFAELDKAIKERETKKGGC